MRVVQTDNRRRKKSNSCLGCLGKLIFVTAVVIIIVLGVNKLDIRTKILEAQYPLRYEQYITEYAIEYQLEPALICAIIYSESKFDAYAVSRTGARGLMQVQEETGYDCSRELKMSEYSNDMLFQPDINIRIGGYYFKKLLKKYNNDVRKAAAAYNAGPGNVDNWIKNPEYIDENGELYKIPFSETSKYVDVIEKAWHIYEDLYYTN